MVYVLEILQLSLVVPESQNLKNIYDKDTVKNVACSLYIKIWSIFDL